MSDVFRICVQAEGGPTHNIDDIPADQAIDVMTRYILHNGAGLEFLTMTGFLSWTWDEIQSIRLVRGSYTVEQYP